MSEANRLPTGFVLDEPDASEPPKGFAVDAPDKSYRSSVLPLSRDAQGNVHFDLHAGVTGALWDAAANAVTLPHDAMTGKVDVSSDEGIGRAFEMGAALTPMSPAKALAVRQATVPTAKALKEASGAGYNAVRDMGVTYSSDAVRALAEATLRQMEDEGLVDNLAPATHSIVSRLAMPPENSVATSAGLEAARRGFGKVRGNFNNPPDQFAASIAQKALDEFVSNPPMEAVLSGSAGDAATALKNARANYAAGSRSDLLQGIEESAGRRAQATNSGLNIDNTVRSRIASLLDNDEARAGFSPAEIAMLEEVARGTPTRNALRWVGNILGGGGGLGAIATGGLGAVSGSHFGLAAGAVLGAGPPAVGLGTRLVANALTKRSLRRVDEAVRSRSPYAEEVASGPGQEIAVSPARQKVMRALLLGSPYYLGQ